MKTISAAGRTHTEAKHPEMHLKCGAKVTEVDLSAAVEGGTTTIAREAEGASETELTVVKL